MAGSGPGGRKPKRAKALGVTDAEYERLLAAQGGGCAICGATPKTRRLHADHVHGSKENRVRGLLCHKHNRWLASWVTDDDLLVARYYLRGGWEDVNDSHEAIQARIRLQFKPTRRRAA